MTDYQTLDSGERAQFDSGMQRDTQAGKPRFDLTWPLDVPYEEQLLVRFANLMARGAEKYTERNWEQAMGDEELARFKSSAFRHFMQWYGGDRSEDHAVAIFFNVMGFEATSYKMDQVDPPTDPATLQWISEREDEISTALEHLRRPPGPGASADVVVEHKVDEPESYCLLDKEGDWWTFEADGGWTFHKRDGTQFVTLRDFDLEQGAKYLAETYGIKKKSKPITSIQVHLNSATPAQVHRSVCEALREEHVRRETQAMMHRAMNGGRLIQ